MSKVRIKDVLAGKHYFIDKKLGEGAFGQVFKVCSTNMKNSCEFVLKKQLVNDLSHIQSEDKMHSIFSKFKLSPKLYDTLIMKEGKKQYAYSLMERVDGVVENLITSHTSKKQLDAIAESIFQLIQKLCLHNLIHGDLHSGNIGYIVNTNKRQLDLKLIDFGWSSKGTCFPELEIVQFLRTLYMTEHKAPKNLSPFEKKYAKKAFDENIKYLEQVIYAVYKDTYNKNLKNSRRAWQKRYDELMDEYVNEYDSKH